MTHLRRIAMPRSFPIRRKGTEKYIVAAFASESVIPLLPVVRDILGIAKTRREVLILLRNSAIHINGKKTTNEKLGMHLFDTIALPALDKYYRMILKKGKFAVESISEKEASTRICKIINKTKVNKGKVQLNLDNGYNLLADLKAAVNDSVVLDFKTGKIARHLPLKEKASVLIIKGSHSGEQGAVIKIKGNNVEIKINKGNVTIPIKNILVTEG